MWLTVDNFKKRTCLGNNVWTNDDIDDFLSKAKEIMAQYIFPRRRYVINTARTQHRVPLSIFYLSDYLTYDDEINKTGHPDIYVFEQDQVTKQVYDITSHVTSVQLVPDTPETNVLLVNFDGNYPTSGRVLYIEYYVSALEWTKIRQQIQDLQLLIAVRELLMDKPMAAATLMASNWSINGVSMNAETGNLNVFYDNINLQINRLYKELQIGIYSMQDLERFDNPYVYYRF